NFEDNLSLPGDENVEFKSSVLAEMLEAWLAQPGHSRLLITSRYPVPLRRLDDHALGPLSPAETRKLIWRLPGLDALEPAEQQRAYVDVGGHPRALEYLDALLRGGEARFPDVAEQLEKVLRERRNVQDPGAWVRDQGTDLDQALAATVTLATSDVLLERLLQGFTDRPLAWPLLLGASVYRLPVEKVALVWQVADESPDLPGKGADTLPDVEEPEAFESALRVLERSGLVAGIDEGGTRRFTVHRWTADALARLASPEEREEADRRAARYWRWRVQTVSYSLGEALEARFHHHQAGELDAAASVTDAVWQQLRTWGAYSREAQLLRETMAWFPDQGREAAAFAHRLGIVEQKRGAYDEALSWYRRSLAILEDLGDRSGLASSYHQLGMIEEDRGSYDEALSWYRRSLAIWEELGDRSGLAKSYHQLGRIEQERGSYDEALSWYRRSLAIKEDLGDRLGLASSYHHLGLLEQLRGSHDEALSWYRRSLAILEDLGDRSGLASSYHQLGMIEEDRGSYDEALSWYRRSLAILEDLGDRLGLASSYHQLGSIEEERGYYDEALSWYRRSLAIREELGDRSGIADSCGQLSIFYTKRDDPEQALPWGLRSLALYQELRSPKMAILLRSMLRQREMLGDERFREVAGEHVGAESVSNLIKLLDQAQQAIDEVEADAVELPSAEAR
ncbi:MAG: tetratricopeptide repeat protein, partial [Acidobacteriota bacterium]